MASSKPIAAKLCWWEQNRASTDSRVLICSQCNQPHCRLFHPLPLTSNSWVCPLMLPELDFFLPCSGALLTLSLVLFQPVAEFSQEPPPHSTKTMMSFTSANLENIIQILWKNCKWYYFSYHQFPPKLICFMMERYCNTARTTCKQEWRQCHWALLFCLSHLIFIFHSCKPKLFS